MGSWTHKPEKRAAAKVVRQKFKKELPMKLEDDYPAAEAEEMYMASICTDERPCHWCQRSEAARQHQKETT